MSEQVRFAAAVAQRLASLGALTKGDRKATEGVDFEQYNVFTSYGDHAAKSLVSANNSGTFVDWCSPDKVCMGERLCLKGR